LRLDTLEIDEKTGFNRPEHLRAIPSLDQDYKRLYGLRPDIESINRGVDDAHYLRRARSWGHARQELNLLGYAIMVNCVTRHRWRSQRGAEPIALPG